ncbi:hypothetical protein FN846DRAFT_975739 [Sphaerosporella brunnea]|uniref:Bromodomain associated domain-containing protein n=1 Tax=Sphaerosporella brunnea TaxID=1250544 RepID=A0A5J5EGR6_9PEZI|nr:hypothetical protein FN846DRAFT_975739 [Sphaerosporella brunnea]
MSDSELFFSLLRISAIQALRAAGITTAKPSVVDSFTDIVARYLMLLGSTTKDMAEGAGRLHAELDDVRMALEHVGIVRPLNVFNDPHDEDTRGVDTLVEWFRGPQAKEMRRVAGTDQDEGTGVKSEEWVNAMMKLAEKRAKME